MKFPVSFLKEFLAFDLTTPQLADTLTFLGIEVEKIQQVENEEILEVSFTPNLIFAQSLLGIARELAAVSGHTLQMPPISVQEANQEVGQFATVSVMESALAPLYTARVLFDVKVAPSPDWLQKRLIQLGARPVNNVVDVTNYVMWEMGLPLHAFDLDKTQAKITVRKAKEGEKISTLDGKERFLTEEMLVVATEKGPQAVAGVMGSAFSEVSETTTRLFLEAACFDSKSVRRTAKQLDLHTEASYRFERGVDPLGPFMALERATHLLQKICGAKVAKGTIEVGSRASSRQILCRFARINHILGTSLSNSEIELLLKKTGAHLKVKDSATLEVTVPSHRIDLNEEIDLVEEVARLYGYDTIHQNHKETYYQDSSVADSFYYGFEKKVRTLLLNLGLQELLTSDLISEKEASFVSSASLNRRSLIHLLNPRSIEQSVLRPSLLPNMLHVVKYNRDHDMTTVQGFEVGRVHLKTKEDKYLEPLVASIVLTGNQAPYHWQTKSRALDFFDLKGLLENLMAQLHVENVRFEPSSQETLHPGKQAKLVVGALELGSFGEVHPSILKQAGIDVPVFFAELSLEDIASLEPSSQKMKPLPVYPSSVRDWTSTVKASVTLATILEAVKKARSPLLEDISLLDLYQSEKLGSDRKNVTLRFIYRDLNRTISFEEVEKEHERLTQMILQQLAQEG